ncbi:MAG: alpha/beta hydrolase [Chromatiaceae bacterium]|jgi:esterase/lipase superfamily enzyme
MPTKTRLKIDSAIFIGSFAWRMLMLVFVYGMHPAVSVAANAGDPQPGAEGPEISVPYVTNRLQINEEAGSTAYGGGRGTPGFGRCTVQFEPIPIITALAPQVPFYVPAERKTLRVERQDDAAAFWDSLTAAVTATATPSVVVFVHGYNYGFERSCKAAAALQRAVRGRATVLLFSWPSNAQPTDYLVDQADVEWSVPLLSEVLQRLGDRVGPSRVQVLAHSLGTRGVMMALDYLAAADDRRPLIGPLVLIASDVDAATFADRLPRLRSLTTSITLYASSNDAPLKASRALHGAPRLGEAGEFLTVAEGMQTIDVSSLGRYQIFGHEYHLFHPRVAADLATLLTTGRDASQRPGLRAARRDGLEYWVFDDAGQATADD